MTLDEYFARMQTESGAFALGQQAERAAVVKYLHIVADCNADVTRRAFAKHLANAIEKGEHVP